ncbi:hypothetical protein IWW48_003971 [Coemansia sp. RSA 1200]|nr:hypothetical protein IWW48_003971 [Coemansia sp. RSA 1200]
MRFPSITGSRLSLLAALACTCAANSAAGQIAKRGGTTIGNIARVIGGEAAGANEFTSTVLLEIGSAQYNSQMCTGSLIASNVVLTAAHCAYATDTVMFNASDFRVMLGHDAISTYDTPASNNKSYGVSKLVVHPDFDMTELKGDIAVLVLEESVASSEDALPILVYSGDYDTDTPIRAAGFGMTNPYNTNSMPTQLMAVNLTIGSDSLCAANTNDFSHEYLICTDGTAGKDTCNGDSGGPLVTPIDHGSSRTALLGLTSYGTSSASNPSGLCAQAGGSGYYTHIAPYIPWIAKSANLDASAISITNSTGVESSSDGDGLDQEDEDSQSASDGDDESTVHSGASSFSTCALLALAVAALSASTALL